MQQELEIRCFCRYRPLLAVAGRDAESGEPFIHIRNVKNQRVFTDVIVTSGTVRIYCRDCTRWQTVTIERVNFTVRSEDLPESIQV